VLDAIGFAGAPERDRIIFHTTIFTTPSELILLPALQGCLQNCFIKER
jgi:hypothetical protein